jgi:Ran GTPase-activating protein (RanGAP) involved in mRNA processing and transport
LPNCNIKDNHLSLLATGLEVNVSLQQLDLSSNLITDIGLYTLFSALSKNKKSPLETLDLSTNFITCKRKIRNLFDIYMNPMMGYGKVLEVNLLDNIIDKPYISVFSANARIEISVICFKEDYDTKLHDSIPIFFQNKIQKNSTPFKNMTMNTQKISSFSPSNTLFQSPSSKQFKSPTQNNTTTSLMKSLTYTPEKKKLSTVKNSYYRIPS